MNVGDVFFLNVADSHRYIVVYSEINPIQRVIVFNFSTHRSGRCDETCIVTPKEYAGIVHDSVIAYSYGALLEGDTLVAFRSQVGRALPKLSDELVKKIIEGALHSPHTKLKIKRLLA